MSLDSIQENFITTGKIPTIKLKELVTDFDASLVKVHFAKTLESFKNSDVYFWPASIGSSCFIGDYRLKVTIECEGIITNDKKSYLLVTGTKVEVFCQWNKMTTPIVQNEFIRVYMSIFISEVTKKFKKYIKSSKEYRKFVK